MSLPAPVKLGAMAIHERAMEAAALGQYREAAAFLEIAINQRPDRYRWWADLGMVFTAMGNWRAAADMFASALHRCPTDFRSLVGLGRVLLESGNPDSAIVPLRSAAGMRPDNPRPRIHQARALAEMDRPEEAVEMLEQVIAAHPEVRAAHALLARIFAACREFSAARQRWEFVAARFPGDREAAAGLMLACSELGEIDRAIECGRSLVRAGLATPELYSAYLYLLLYSRRETAESIRREFRNFGRFLQPERTAVFDPAGMDSERKLRIGYLSGEFIRGPSYYFLAPLIGNHSAGFEVYCYHTRDRVDDRTDWFRAASRWRDCRRMSTEELTVLVRQDAIDILVDLSGVYPGHGLAVFAGRAAPVQVSYPNCPVTTGVAQMDYFFTDTWTCPDGMESQYIETAVHLPGGYLVYLPPDAAPAVTPLPAAVNGFITFGIFQRRAKMNAAVWDAAAGALRLCPESRLLIQNVDLTGDPDCEFRGRLEREFSDRGIDPRRLICKPGCSQPETMAIMAEADIALDTFPYQGQTTTCECLWMGVPVVTLAGRAHVARVGSALLQRAGLGHLVAETGEEYGRIAARLAGDWDELARLRSGMRPRLEAYGITDGRRLAGEVEEAYRSMWRLWCAGPGKQV